nr:beta-lactamase family protein [Geodermatophilaceae bacterium]
MSIQELGRWLQRRADADEFSGVVLIRQDLETVFAGGYGPATRRWPVQNTVDTRFDTASITKLFTGIAALQLVGEGRLALDASITNIVDLAGTTISADVTVRHLLTHTSGIADDADEEAGEDYAALWIDKPVYSVVETRDFLPLYAYKPALFAPGENCRYCNVGNNLVGLAIEAVTWTPYREHVRSTVFGPAGMAASEFFDRRDPAPDVAEGWDPVVDESGTRTGWKSNIYSYPPIGSPADGAHVTAGDLVHIAQSVRAGRLLTPELTEAFLTPQVLRKWIIGKSGILLG